MSEEFESVEQPGQVKRKNKKGKRLLPLLLFLLLLIALGVGGFLWYKSTRPSDNVTQYWFDKAAQDGTLEGKTPAQIGEMLNTIIEEGMFNVSINARIVFEDGKSEGSMGLENIPENRYYSRIIITKDDDGSVLYESKGIKPGQYIDKIKLKKNLPAGDYDCTGRVVVTDPESLQDIGQVRVKVKVIVVN